MSQIRFDSHCHLFNGEFAFREALAILWDIIRGRYPHEVARALGVKAIMPLSACDRWKAKLKYIASLFSVVTGSCEDNYQFELKGYAQSSIPNSQLVLMPLMMDIFYIFADGISFGLKVSKEIPPTDENLEQFKTQAKALMQDVLREASNTLALKSLTTKTARQENLQQIQTRMETLIDEYSAELSAQGKAGAPGLRAAAVFNFAGAEISWGFRDHFLELSALQQKYPKAVFPFLAVDPRRPNITQLVTNGKVISSGKKIISKDGPFYGIKIYPPLGYFPNDPRLDDIYAYCQLKDIPITAHCQPVSFVNPLDPIPNPSQYFAHPNNWKSVLQKFPSLRLNLAHFGGVDSVIAYANDPTSSNGEWTKVIIDLLTYKNVYTDIAAFADPGIAPSLIKILKIPIVQEKLLFGTDYVINMLHGNLHGRIETYFNNLSTLPPRLFIDNPLKFLAVPGFRSFVYGLRIASKG